MTAFRRIIAALAIGRIDTDEVSLYDFRRLWIIPAWAQVVIIVGLYVATVLRTDHEYRAHGTVFGFSGAAFYMLLAPILEELVFRGWVISRIIRRHSNVTAIVVSSLLFGIMHIRNVYWLETDTLVQKMAYMTLIIGPLFAYVTLRTRSVWPAVMLHYLNNLMYYL